MTLKNYPKQIKIQAWIMYIIGLLSIAGTCLTQFSRTFNHLINNDKIQILLAVVVVALAVLQYVCMKNILKKRLAKASYSTFEEKIEKYYKIMTQTFWILAIIFLSMFVISIFIYNTLIICLMLVMYVFSIAILRPEPYRLKIDLNLNDDDVAKIYGKNWNKCN